MKIFYYTGTGNSLYIAKQLSKDIYSIPKLINDDNLVFEDQEIGIVCPLYCHMPPVTVQEFLAKVTFKAKYFFVIFTYGNRKCDAYEWMDQYLNSCNIKCDYLDSIKMVDNYLPSFDMNEQMKMDKQIDQQIQRVINNVKQQKLGYEKTTDEEKQHHLKIMQMFKESPELFDGSLIKVGDNCIGCGTCQKVCPKGKYSIIDGKAYRKPGSCDNCQGCAQNCPTKTIIPGSGDKNPQARFRNEHISLQEIINSNNILKNGDE